MARRTGFTFRLLLWALHEASYKPNKNIFLIFSAKPALDHALRQATRMCEGVRDFARTVGQDNTILFNNGSRIKFVVKEQLKYHDITRGLSNVVTQFDNSCDT